jgi:ribosomal protein L29
MSACGTCGCDAAKLTEARAERDALRAALKECLLHMRHAKDCATKDTIWKPCDCGMPEAAKLARELLSELAAERAKKSADGSEGRQ